MFNFISNLTFKIWVLIIFGGALNSQAN